MLVSPHDGGVEHHVLIVGICGQVLEDALEHAALGLAAEALVGTLPITKPRSQIAPGDASPVATDHRLHKEPIVRSRPADMTLSSRQEIPDPLPPVVSQAVAPHDQPLTKLITPESFKPPQRKPPTEDTT